LPWHFRLPLSSIIRNGSSQFATPAERQTSISNHSSKRRCSFKILGRVAIEMGRKTEISAIDEYSYANRILSLRKNRAFSSSDGHRRVRAKSLTIASTRSAQVNSSNWRSSVLTTGWTAKPKLTTGIIRTRRNSYASKSVRVFHVTTVRLSPRVRARQAYSPCPYI
jgi:hypothetical protein